jgi:hypothetical protein
MKFDIVSVVTWVGVVVFAAMVWGLVLWAIFGGAS